MSVPRKHIAFFSLPILLGLVGPAWAQKGVAQTSAEDARLHSESIPHQPNFLGLNICIGVDLSVGAPSFPTIVTSRKLGVQAATHRLQFAKGEVDISEDFVGEVACAGLPMDDPRWSANGTGLFCLKSWTRGKFVKVSMEAKPARNGDPLALQRAIYAIGPCQIGAIDPGTRQSYGYGETLQVAPIPVRGPEQ